MGCIKFLIGISIFYFISISFSVGDELGFGQSLSNLDTSKRRSVGTREGVVATANLGNQMQQGQQKGNQPKPKKNRLTVRMPSTPSSPAPITQTTVSAKPIILVEDNAIQTGRSQSSVRQLSLTKPSPIAVPPFKPIPPAQDMLAPVPTSPTLPQTPKYVPYAIPTQGTMKVMTPTQGQIRNLNRMGQVPKTNLVNVSAAPMRVSSVGQNLMSVTKGVSNSADQAFRTIPAPVMTGMGQYPSFQALPDSTSKIVNQVASYKIEDPSKPVGSVSIVSSQAYKNPVQVALNPSMMANAQFVQNALAMRRAQEEQAYLYQAQNNGYSQQSSQFSYNQIPSYVAKPKIDNMISQNTITNHNNEYDFIPEGTMQEKILAISRATNISVEAIEAAIRLRQQQLVNQMLNAPPRTTTTTTTPRPRPPPPPPKRYSKPQDPTQKVMNAPKEYYPVGYDKNYDDNFVSKVELPETSFYCGDQKHFPGLYGDEDLGCMVFHVCALTDDGLIMKSFLCPESTLFDQTILKCNWWFYVDCKNSKRLYDSNIPISKSYQLMKALTFFSSYKKENQGEDQNNAQTTITENKQGVKNAVEILQKQSHMKLPKVEIIEVGSSRNHSQDSRNSKIFTPVNVNEINSLSVTVNEKDNVSGETVDKTNKVSRKYRVNTQRYTIPNISEKVQNVTNILPQEVKDNKQTSTAIPVTTSTDKSVEKSTSVERKSKRRRIPNLSNRSKELIVNSSSENKNNETSSQKHRSERASEELNDERKINKTLLKPKLQISVKEVVKNSKSKTIAPKRGSVDVTIAKMDQAIMGSKNNDTIPK